MSRKPADIRLLIGVDRALEGLIPEIGDATHASTLETVRAVIGELLTRQNVDHQDRLIGEGLQLVDRARQLLGDDRRDSAHFDAAALLLTSAGGSCGEDLVGHCLTLATELVGQIGGVEAGALLDAIVDWEVLRWSTVKPALPPGKPKVAPDRQVVERLMQASDAWRDATISRYDQIAGGYSKTTVMVDVAASGEAPDQLVLRAEQASTPFMIDGADVVLEYHALRAIHQAGLPVAEPLMVEVDRAAAGTRFLISRRLPGRNCGNYLGGALQNPGKTLESLVTTLANIHTTSFDASSDDFRQSHLAPWARHETIESATRAFVAYWREMARRSGCGTSPAVQRAFDWLERNVPSVRQPPVLVHGDYGLHNVLIENDVVSGVIDWESSTFCDPADDFPTLFGAMRPYFSEDEVYRLYRERGGLEISEFRLRYFMVLACMKPIILGQASLELLDREANADLNFSFIAYRYVEPLVARLNEAIRSAEAAR